MISETHRERGRKLLKRDYTPALCFKFILDYSAYLKSIMSFVPNNFSQITVDSSLGSKNF